MSKNVGKIFEDDIKSSVPDYCLIIRLPDPAQSFGNRIGTRFSMKNPCDYLIFDTKNRIFLPIELKTTKNKSISFDDIDYDGKQSHMIHKHQILGLTEYSKYDNVVAGFLFCFRDEKNNCEHCYFQRIEDFNNMVSQIDKKSFNEKDLMNIGSPIVVEGEQKRIRYNWNIESLLDEINNKYIC